MRVIDLRQFMEKEGRRAAKAMAKRLQGRRGVGGRFLAAKKRPNGRPLGVGKSARGIIGLLAGATVVGKLKGFTLFFKFPTGRGRVSWFHFGRPPVQVPRPVAGMGKGEEKQVAFRAAIEARKQLQKAVRNAR